MKCLFVAFSAVVIISGVASLNCYQCNSHYNDECSDFSEQLYKQNFDGLCEPAQNVCRKMITFGESIGKRVIRECGTVPEADLAREWHQPKGYNKVGLDIFTCQQDGCNAAEKPITHGLLVILGLVPAFILMK